MRGAALVIGWLLTLGATAQAVMGQSLRAVPTPPTAGMEPAVQQQLAAVAEALDRATGRPEAPIAERLAAFGECGMTYAAYGQFAPARACLENASRLAPEDARWPYYLGVLAQDDGDFATAIAAFESADELRGEDPATLLRLGNVLLAAGEQERAEEVFRRALPVYGAIAGAHYGLGRIALDRQRIPEAIAHFEAALQRQPGASVVRYPLGQAYRRAGRLEEARRELAARGDVEVRFPDPLLAELGSRNRGSQHLISLGNEALGQKRFAMAIQAFELALVSRPEDSSTWTKTGVAHESLGGLQEAERCYRQAIAINPENARAQYNLGTLLARTARLGEGIGHLEAAVRLAPDAPAMAFNLARALTESGENARAIEVYDRLLQRAPSDSEARFARALALIAVERYEEAAVELAAVVAQAPDELAPRLAEARALLNGGREAEARTRLEAAAERFPDSSEPVLLLVRTLTSAGTAGGRDAARASELAETLPVGGAEREEALALSLAALGRWAEAEAYAVEAVRLSGPTDPAGERRRRCLERLRLQQPCRTAPGAW